MATALIASFTANYLQRRENVILIDASEKMEAELQIFDVVDKDKIHVLELNDPLKMVWRFRVYIPPGRHMQLRWADGLVDETGFPPLRYWHKSSFEGRDELQTIAFQIQRIEEKKLAIMNVVNGQAMGQMSFYDNGNIDWLFQLEDPFVFTPAARKSTPVLSDWGKRIVLLERSETDLKAINGFTPKKNKKSQLLSALPTPSRKFMIWLEPVDPDTKAFFVIPDPAAPRGFRAPSQPNK